MVVHAKKPVDTGFYRQFINLEIAPEMHETLGRCEAIRSQR